MTVHLTIHKCKECPKHFVWRDDDHNIVRRCNLAMTHIHDPQTIPTWCPLRKEEKE